MACARDNAMVALHEKEDLERQETHDRQLAFGLAVSLYLKPVTPKAKTFSMLWLALWVAGFIHAVTDRLRCLI